MAWPSARYLAFRLIQTASRRLPQGTAVRIAERLADGYASGARADRAAIRHNLELMLGRPVPPDAAAIGEVFRHFSRYLVEFFTAHDPARVVMTADGGEHVRAALAMGRGAIALTAHVANWEFGAVALRRLGFRIAAVALPHRDPRINQLFDRQRLRCGVEVIPLDAATTAACLRHLRRGGLLGLLGDQVYTEAGLLMPFGRWQVRLPRGPAVMSLRTGAPVLPTFVTRQAPCRLRLRVEPAILPEAADAGDRGDRVAELTRRYAAAMQRAIEQVPEQWLRFQRIEAR